MEGGRLDFTALNGAEQIIRQIRVVELNGQPWFVLSDVCRTIGYVLKPGGKVNTANASRLLGSDEKGTADISTPGCVQPGTIISESGLFKVILRSKTPVAVPGLGHERRFPGHPQGR